VGGQARAEAARTLAFREDRKRLFLDHAGKQCGTTAMKLLAASHSG
jgi:hypothetical protein